MDYLKNSNLLLIEDDDEVRENFTQTLSYYFKNIFEAKNGIEALEIFERESIHIIFCDYLMPEMDGVEFITIIRKNNKKIPIAIISNYTDKEVLLKCITLNLMGYITKPLSYTSLKQFLNEKVIPEAKEYIISYEFSKECYFIPSSNELVLKENSYHLTKLEKQLFELLLDNNGKPVSIDTIEEYLYPNQIHDGSGVKNLIYRIRKKYGFEYIENIKEIGYMLKSL